jgi:hypothetical protein
VAKSIGGSASVSRSTSSSLNSPGILRAELGAVAQRAHDLVVGVLDRGLVDLPVVDAIEQLAQAQLGAPIGTRAQGGEHHHHDRQPQQEPERRRTKDPSHDGFRVPAALDHRPCGR